MMMTTMMIDTIWRYEEIEVRGSGGRDDLPNVRDLSTMVKKKISDKKLPDATEQAPTIGRPLLPYRSAGSYSVSFDRFDSLSYRRPRRAGIPSRP